MSAGTGSATGQANVNAGGGYGPDATGSTTGESVVAAKSTVLLVLESQQALLADVARVPDTNASQVALLTMGGLVADYIFNSQEALLALTQITAQETYESQQALLAAGANPMTDTNISQLAMLTLVRSNPDRRQMRAWPFWQTGHHYYVLHLGNTTTLVFDTLTRKWSEWRTELMNNWRAGYGVNWNEDVVAGGIDNNILYLVSDAAATDDGLPIVSIITGGYPMRMRYSATCDEVMVTSSVGMTSNVDAEMGLRTSDDYGLTWNDWGTLALDTASPRTQVTWQSLGEITAPGRIFEITDSGAAKRINSLDMYSRDLKDG